MNSHCSCSAMNVCWSFGPPPSRQSSPPVTISKTVSSSYCGEPVPQSPTLMEQAPLPTLSPVTLVNLPTHSRPLPSLVTALSSVSSLPPQVPVSRTPLQPPILILKRVFFKPRQRPNVRGMVKSTPSKSIQTPRSLVLPCCTLACTTAWLLDSVYVSDPPPLADSVLLTLPHSLHLQRCRFLAQILAT
jgi:hypothetical protein